MKKIVIIGGGPAGLTAAYELLKENSKDYQVVILEESQTLGGISRTVQHNGNRMDIGGHRFFSKNSHIMSWWNEIMPLQASPSFDDKVLGRKKHLAKIGPDPEKEDIVMLSRERVSRIYYKNAFFDYPVSMNLQTIKNMGFSTTMLAGLSYLKSVFFKLPENNLENFYINRFGRVLYSMFFEGYTEKLWGRHPRNISADWGSQRVKGLSIFAILKDIFSKISGNKNNKNAETSLIEEFYYPKFGPGQLWEQVGKLIEEKGGKIYYNHKVQKIHAKNGKIDHLTCQSPDGDIDINADVFFSSMPLKDLVDNLDSDKPINPKLKKVAHHLPYRDFVTVGLLVNKLELENKTKKRTLANIVPDCWIYVQDRRVKLGRIQIFNNWSPYMVKKPTETVWIGLEYFCDEGDKFWNLSDEECISLATNELIKMGIIKKGAVLDSHREKVKKAYPAYFDTYKYLDRLIKFLDKYPNLYCIGRNGQHRYNNMDHSMLTAINAVKVFKEDKSDKSSIWNVNTEADYHESK